MLQALDLNDHSIFDNQIKPVSAIQLHSLVINRKLHLPPKSNTAKMEFVTKALFVRGF